MSQSASPRVIGNAGKAPMRTSLPCMPAERESRLYSTAVSAMCSRSCMSDQTLTAPRLH